MRRSLVLLAGVLSLLALLGLPMAAAAQEGGDGPSFRVRYRSADTIYLEAGREEGLSVGDRLEVQRGGKVVAVIEVVFVARHSASARRVEAPGTEGGDILAGDLARPLGELKPPPREEPAAREEPAGEAVRPRTSTPSRASQSRRRTRLSGVASVDWETWRDDAGERDVDLTTARISLRGRNLGGLPLDLRVRLRSRQVERSRPFLSGDVPESEDRDRLYELSLRWQDPSDRWSLELGRLGAGPFAGVGYLDGASGEFRVLPGWQLGAFYGQRPELGELGFDSDGSKFGVFSRWTPASASGPWEVFVAGIREEDDAGLSRDLLVLETRLGRAGGRWSLFQRAEVDLMSDDALAGDDGSGRLSQVALALTGRLGDRSRVVLSYDRYDPLLLFEDEDDGPSQRFEDLLRQGLRASLYLGRAGGTNLSLSASVREGEGDDDSTYSAGVGLHAARFRGFSVGGDVLVFSNFLTEGGLVTLRAHHGFAGGHSVDLTVGSTLYREELIDEERVSSWARLAAWVELPASFFARGEVEVRAGDDAEGQRLGLGLGYRF